MEKLGRVAMARQLTGSDIAYGHYDRRWCPDHAGSRHFRVAIEIRSQYERFVLTQPAT